MKFSEKYGYSPIRDVLQVESINEDLQNLIWNAILDTFLNEKILGEDGLISFLEYIWSIYLKKPADEINIYNYNSVNYSFFKKYYFNSKWFEKYDLIQELCYLQESLNKHFGSKKIKFKDKINQILKMELSAYRIISDKVIQITKEEEIIEVEEAIKNTDKYNSVNQHLKVAISLFSNKQKPDYRNSIKESISAVESICKIIARKEDATLYDALKEIETKHAIHKALKNSFTSLYGFTSGAGGIRHALLENDIIVGFEEAKLILVSSSAFINFLISKYDTN